MLHQIIFVYFIATQFAVFAEFSAFKAFADFLNINHLHHGIVVQDCVRLNLPPLKDKRDLLEDNQRIRFFNVRGAKVEDDFRTIFYASSPRVGVLVSRMESVAVQQAVFAAASADDLFNNSQAWFIMAADFKQFHTNVKSIFGKLKININADITVGVKTSNNSVVLYDLYKVHQSVAEMPLEIVEKGTWSAEAGIQLLAKFRENFVRRRRNFRNLTIFASTTIIEKPTNLNVFEYLANSRDNKQLDSMQRKTYNLLKMLEPMLNVSFEIVFSDTWGRYVDGNWTGVISDLHAGRAEFAICPLRFTQERVKVIQYTPELHTEIVRFLFRHPRRNVIRNIFFEPLTDLVWWSVLALTVLTILLMALHVQHEHKEQQQRRRRRRQQQQQHHTITIERRLDGIVLIVLEAIFMQGPAPNIFVLPSTRILILTICIFSVMLLQYYAAFIVGSLLAVVPRSITTLPTLFNSSLEIGMERVAYNYEIFSNTTNQVASDFYTQRIVRNPSAHILTMERGAERIGRGGFAFHVAVDRAYRILKYLLSESEFCDLQEIALHPPFTIGSALRKNSPYREYFAQTILKFRDTGLMQYNDKLWAVPKTDCSLRKNTEVEVDIEHFIPALVLLTMAIIISVLVLVVELAVNWCCQRQPLKQQKIRKFQQRENF